MKAITRILALVSCLAAAVQADADIIVTNLDPVSAVYDGTNVATIGGGVPQPTLANGHAFNIEFTPTGADVANTVLLMEIGGTANGTGLYLINGVLAYLTKQNADDSQVASGLDDTFLGPEPDESAAVTNTFGPVVAGEAYTAAASWDNAGNLILAIQADNLATGKIDNITITGTYGNWSGDESFSVGTNPRVGAGGPGGSVGGMSGENALNEFGEPFDVEDDLETPILKGFQGTITRALYWNAVGQIGLFPSGVTLGLSWTNTGTGSWGVAGNWSPNTVPTATDSPKINNGGTAQIADGNDYEVDLLYLGVGPGNSGTLQISNGSLTPTNSPIDVGSGSGASATLNISGTGSLSIPGTMRMGSDGATATVNVSGGAVAAGYLRIGVDDLDGTSGGQGHFNVLGGTLYVTNDLNVGRDNEVGFLTVNGGAVTNLNLSGAANDYLTIGGPGGTGTVSVVSGSVYSATGIRMANGNPAQATLTLNGGTLATRQIFKGNAASTATVEFNGGTLRALTNNVPLIASNANFTVNVNNGDAIIDTAGYDTAIELPINAIGSGGLIKNGGGNLSLYAVNYNGATVVNAGKLSFGLPSYTSGAVTVADAAGLGLVQREAYSALYATSLTVGSSGATTIDFDCGSFPNPVVAPLQVSGALTANGNITINVSGSAMSLGQTPLISYGTLGGAGFSAFHLVGLPEGVTANLVNTGSSIDLNITAAGKTLTWSGASSANWDTMTMNWINADTTLAATYSQSGGFGDRVTFDDSNLSGNTNINLTIAVTPQAMTVGGSSLDYIFGGAGRISGGVSLEKTGFGGLTLLTSNDYSGGTLISDGAVRLGDNAALGTGIITFAGNFITLSSDGGTPRTISNNIAYTGNLTLGDLVRNGTLSLAGNADLGAADRNLALNSDVIIAGSLTNSVAGVGLNSITGTGRLTVAGSGYVNIAELFEQVNGSVVVDGGTFINMEGYRLCAPQPNSTQTLLVTNNGYFAMDHPGGGGNLVIGSSAVASDTTATNLIEVASGTLVARTPSGGNGRILFSQNNGGAAAIMNIRAGGTVQCRRFEGQQGTSGRVSELNFYGGTIQPIANEGSFITTMSNVFVHTGVTVDTLTNTITIPQPLLAGTGGGGLTKEGSGTLNLNGANTYTGSTMVNAGALGGTGSLASPVVVASGGTLSPGLSIGTLTVNNSLTLNAGSQTLIEVNKGVSPSNDIVNVTGILTYGGVLTVTNVGTNVLAAGDSFTVFPTGGGAAFSAVQGDAGPGLAFQFSDGVVTVISAAAQELGYLLSGDTITFTWADPSYSLEAQTNALSVGLSPAGWTPYSGGTTSGTVVTIDATQPAVFFRLSK